MESESQDKKKTREKQGRNHSLIKQPVGLLALIIFLFIVHAAATYFSWYFIYPWLDVPMHLIGGFWVGLLFFYLFFERRQILNQEISPIYLMLLALGFVSLFGVCWEFYEYVSFYGLHLPGEPGAITRPGIYEDTLIDLLNALIGAGLAFWIKTRRSVIDQPYSR